MPNSYLAFGNMLNYIYYIIYLSFKTPGKKRRGGRKQSAKHAFSMLVGYYAQGPFWFLAYVAYDFLYLIPFEFFLQLFFWTFFLVALPVKFILDKKYTYQRINDIEEKYNNSLLKIWQANLLYAILVFGGVLGSLLFYIEMAKIERIREGKAWIMFLNDLTIV